MCNSKHFVVDEFEIMDNLIEVSIRKTTMSINITIGIEKFQAFLLMNGKLECGMNLSDPFGALEQSGNSVMSYKEYWEQDKQFIHEDLYEYICKNPITYRGKDYEDSLRSINAAFDAYIVKKRSRLMVLVGVILSLCICFSVTAAAQVKPKPLHTGYYTYNHLVKMGYAGEPYKQKRYCRVNNDTVIVFKRVPLY